MPSALPSISPTAVPWLTVEQIVEADRLAIDEFGIELLQMMEHAGSNLAHLTHRLAPDGAITVLAGGGNNGGGGLCAARHLANMGREVEVVLATDRLGAAPTHHIATLGQMGIVPAEHPSSNPVVIDAIVGYGISGALRRNAADLVESVRGAFIVSLDMPSGLGSAGAVSPGATLTLALPKVGLERVGGLYLADLGLPAALWRRMGLAVPALFADSPIVAIAG
jgi:NAD(P)H-hydrate epimerase